MRGPTFFSFLLVEIKRFRYFGVQTFVQLLRHHKRQIPGVGRNVYVWQLNAVLPTTGLILHPGDSRELGGWKGANGRSQVPCLWLPADALSLDAPSWCWTPHPSGTVPNIHVQPNKARRKDWKMLTKVCLSSEVDDVMFNVPPPPGADRLNRSRVINWSKRLSSFSAQFWVEGWPPYGTMLGKVKISLDRSRHLYWEDIEQ